MDFAALMSKEISKAKGPEKSSGKETDKSSTQPTKKYMRRGDVEAARVEAYKQEQERLAREREERIANKRKLDEEEADRKREREDKKRRLAEESKARREEEELAKERERRRRLGLPDLPEDKPEDVPEEEDIEEDELIEKLRAMDAPARLFGEDYKARLRRYRRLVQRAAIPKQKITDGPIPTTLEPVSGGTDDHSGNDPQGPRESTVPFPAVGLILQHGFVRMGIGSGKAGCHRAAEFPGKASIQCYDPIP